MSVLGFLLLLGAALSNAALDGLRMRLVRAWGAWPLVFWLCAGALPFFVVAWWASGAPAPRPGYWLPALLSVALNIVANGAYLRAIALSGLASTIPLLSLTPVFSSLLAVPLLGEVPAPRQAFGIVVVVLGALWLPLAGGSASAAPAASRRGPWLMMLVALLWSAAIALDKVALLASSVAWHGLVLYVGVGSGAAAFAWWHGLSLRVPAASEGERPGRQHTWMVLAILCGVLALAFNFLALERVLAGLVETCRRGFGSLAAIAMGIWLFGERAITGRQLLAVVMMLAGIAAILL